jgi:hypothetical protein
MVTRATLAIVNPAMPSTSLTRTGRGRVKKRLLTLPIVKMNGF